jgi:hypothetical protein
MSLMSAVTQITLVRCQEISIMFLFYSIDLVNNFVHMVWTPIKQRYQELMQSWIRTRPRYFCSTDVLFCNPCNLLRPCGCTSNLLTWNYFCILRYFLYEVCGAFQVQHAEVHYSYTLFKQQSDGQFFS